MEIEPVKSFDHTLDKGPFEDILNKCVHDYVMDVIPKNRACYHIYNAILDHNPEELKYEIFRGLTGDGLGINERKIYYDCDMTQRSEPLAIVGYREINMLRTATGRIGYLNHVDSSYRNMNDVVINENNRNINWNESFEEGNGCIGLPWIRKLELFTNPVYWPEKRNLKKLKDIGIPNGYIDNTNNRNTNYNNNVSQLYKQNLFPLSPIEYNPIDEKIQSIFKPRGLPKNHYLGINDPQSTDSNPQKGIIILSMDDLLTAGTAGRNLYTKGIMIANGAMSASCSNAEGTSYTFAEYYELDENDNMINGTQYFANYKQDKNMGIKHGYGTNFGAMQVNNGNNNIAAAFDCNNIPIRSELRITMGQRGTREPILHGYYVHGPPTTTNNIENRLILHGFSRNYTYHPTVMSNERNKNYISFMHIKLLLRVAKKHSDVTKKIHKLISDLNIEYSHLVEMIKTAYSEHCATKFVDFFKNTLLNHFPVKIENQTHLTAFNNEFHAMYLDRCCGSKLLLSFLDSLYPVYNNCRYKACLYTWHMKPKWSRFSHTLKFVPWSDELSAMSFIKFKRDFGMEGYNKYFNYPYCTFSKLANFAKTRIFGDDKIYWIEDGTTQKFDKHIDFDFYRTEYPIEILHDLLSGFSSNTGKFTNFARVEVEGSPNINEMVGLDRLPRVPNKIKHHLLLYSNKVEFIVALVYYLFELYFLQTGQVSIPKFEEYITNFNENKTMSTFKDEKDANNFVTLIMELNKIVVNVENNKAVIKRDRLKSFSAIKRKCTGIIEFSKPLTNSNHYVRYVVDDFVFWINIWILINHLGYNVNITKKMRTYINCN